MELAHIAIVEKQIHTLLPGEATYANANHDGSRKAWFIGCPSGKGCIANLSAHGVAYHEQEKLLTVSPSILCGCGAHYFIEQNRIRWC